MTDHEFEEEKVKKALRCCAQPDPICKECPYYDPYLKYPCADQLKWAALNLIDRQKAQIESLNAVQADAIESLRLAAEANKDMQAEIEMLEKHMVFEIESAYDRGAKATIKEFSERLKADIVETGDEHGLGNSYPILTHNYIDTLVKEMTEVTK